MRDIQRKNYSEEFREKVLSTYYGSQETVLMIARRFGVKRDTMASWVRRHDRSYAPCEQKGMKETARKASSFPGRSLSI
ncbi:MAG: transposase [Tannerellaceae bacterium]|nr:transposase [Tannerellaceae bacterium]